jgi:hypothetical protein
VLNFCGGDSERKGRPHSTKKEMPTVRELEFDEEDYETDSDDEEEEETFMERMSEKFSTLKEFVKGPVYQYGGSALWVIMTTSLVMVMPLMISVEKEHAVQEQMSQYNAQQQAKGGAGIGGAPMPNHQSPPAPGPLPIPAPIRA